MSFRNAELPQLPKPKLKILSLQCLAPYRQQDSINEKKKSLRIMLLKNNFVC